MTRPTPAAVRYTAVLPWRPKAKTDGPNARQHYMARYRHNSAVEKAIVSVLLVNQWPKQLPEGGRGYVVTFTARCARGPLMDSDNLQGCFKKARDAVAWFLNVSDAPGGIEWRYVAERGHDSTEITLEGERV